jgi:HSP20 family protein
VTLMPLDPFRDFGRLAEQTLSVGARALCSMPMEALRRGDEVLVDERPRDEFVWKLFLGDTLDAERLTAEARDGVLTLTIPVSEASRPRRVVLGSADRSSDAPNVVGSVPAPAQQAAAAATEPAPT